MHVPHAPFSLALQLPNTSYLLCTEACDYILAGEFEQGASGSPNGVIGGPGPPMFRPTDIVMYCIITHSN